MVTFNRRLLYWLVKAYVKKWGKVILLSFFAGLVIFFTLLTSSRFLIQLLPIEHKISVGYLGAYTIDTLPPHIIQKISRGLTKLEKDGTIKPDVAKSWKVANDGKTYVFTLRDDVFYSDGKKLTAQSIPYEFTGVKKEAPDNHTISYTLSDQYSPFLVTVSRPILKKGFIGIGDYTIQNIETNGEFVKSLTLVSRKNRLITEQYIFYPTEDALKTAFALGEVSRITGLSNDTYLHTQFSTFPNTHVQKQTDTSNLVTLFFYTKDALLSEPKLRSGLTYALPGSYSQGERTYLPYDPNSKFINDEGIERPQDLAHAALLVNAASEQSSAGSKLKLTLKTLPKYRQTAEAVKEAWSKVNVETVIEEVKGKPDIFQAYLGDFALPRDPDQYTLWHSTSPNNITRLKNLRIDKLLEDGRKTTNEKERIQLYKDFQKYLIEDSPAAFLYFPYEYTVERK